MGRKIKETKNEEAVALSFFERRKQIFNPSSGVIHDVFINVSDQQKITPFTEHGIRVLVAKYPDFYKIYFCKYMFPGVDNFPYGGIKVWNVEVDQLQCFYYDSVAIHPSGGSHRLYDKE